MIKKLANLFCKIKSPILFVLVILLDQLSKYWAQTHGLVLINSGISFSLFANFEMTKPVLLLILIAILLVLLILMRKFPETAVLSSIFLASAFSNILDRIVFSGVRDWLVVPILGLKNNLADWLMFLTITFYLLKNISYANRNHL